MPSVSVIMPAYNAESFILESVQSLLKSPVVAEVVVVNDRSTDRTVAVVESIQDPRVKIVEGPGQGISAALNTGFKAAESDLIARCDADDLYPQMRLEKQCEILAAKADFIAVSSGFETITHSGAHVADLAAEGEGRDVTAELLRGEPVTHFCTWLVRKEALVQLGGARTWFETAEDLDLQFRLASRGKVWHEPGIAYSYRLHKDSITHTQANQKRQFFEASAKAFARQRLETNTDALEMGSPPAKPQSQEAQPSSVRGQISGQMVSQSWSAYQKRDYGKALNLAVRSIQYSPGSLSAWRSFVSLLFKSTFVRK